MRRKAVTVEQLHELVKQELDNGNGDKEILLSQDAEGNGVHEMFYGITTGNDVELYGYSSKNYVLIG